MLHRILASGGRGRRRRARGSALVSAALALGCIATNPDWDDSRVGDEHGGAADDADGPDGGSSGGARESTEGAPPDGTTAGADDDDGAADDDDGNPAPIPDAGSPEEPCLAQGLARCEDETMEVCVDLSSNPNHCGECFNDCTEIPGAACLGSVCACTGGEWWTICDGACKRVKDDPHACGLDCVDCFETIGEDAECKNGACKPG